MEEVAVRVRAYGRVQGVFFRAFTRDQALEAGIKGTVQNLPDGTVEALLQGPADLVERVKEAMREGPPASKVRSVEAEDTEMNRGLSTFRILR